MAKTNPITKGVARNTASAQELLLNARERAASPPGTNVYRTDLELAPGLVVSAVRIKLLTEQQMKKGASPKGATLGFVDMQLAERAWLNGFKIYRSTKNGFTALMNPSQPDKGGEKWYNTAFFTREDLAAILDAARNALRKAQEVRAS